MEDLKLGDHIQLKKKYTDYWRGFVGQVVEVEPLKVEIIKQDPKNYLYRVGDTFIVNDTFYYEKA